jgi:hypothetical protein
MPEQTVRWGAAAGGALLAEFGQLAAAVVWVAFYSYVIDPGQPTAVYAQHAQVSGPWVSIVAGAPIFYAASRWIARARRTALALWGVFAVVDGALLVATWAGGGAMLGLQALASYATKLLACDRGGRHAEVRTA